MQRAGGRLATIVFERRAETLDDHGNEIGGWISLGSASARVFWGRGEERREAARLEASQTASFVVLASARTRGVLPTDRITLGGFAWDIKGIVPLGMTEIEFTAARGEAVA